MSNKLKPPPLPPRKARTGARSASKATQEVNAVQILSEEPSLEALADPYLNGAGKRRRPPPPPPSRKAAGAISGGTVEVESVQVVSERQVTVESRSVAASRGSAIYARVECEIPPNSLSHDEGLLLSVIDGQRDVHVIGSISGIEAEEVQRLLDGLARRSIVVRRT